MCRAQLSLSPQSPPSPPPTQPFGGANGAASGIVQDFLDDLQWGWVFVGRDARRSAARGPQ